jgi:hypothetical protein
VKKELDVGQKYWLVLCNQWLVWLARQWFPGSQAPLLFPHPLEDLRNQVGGMVSEWLCNTRQSKIMEIPAERKRNFQLSALFLLLFEDLIDIIDL